MRSSREMNGALQNVFHLVQYGSGMFTLSLLAHGFDWLIFTYFNATQNLNLTMSTRTTKNLK